MRADCFLPEIKLLAGNVLKYQEDSTSCATSSVLQDSYKTNEFIKPKILVFSKEAN